MLNCNTYNSNLVNSTSTILYINTSISLDPPINATDIKLGLESLKNKDIDFERISRISNANNSV